MIRVLTGIPDLVVKEVRSRYRISAELPEVGVNVVQQWLYGGNKAKS